MADTTPPSPPVVTTTAISGTQIDLSWTAKDDTGVVKYEVRRDGALLATVTGNHYSDTKLAGGHTYSYVITAFDAANNSNSSAAVSGMTLWWPEGYDLPAFRLKRQTYGLMSGGDWTRGSSVTTLPHTALRYPTTTPADYDPSTSKAIMHCRPFDYHTVEVFWGWPTAHPNWQEVALVRSTFGHPATPRDGMTVFRAMREAFTTDTGIMAPPVVYDQPMPSGRWYYYTLFFRTNPIQWVKAMSDGCVLPKDYEHREHLWNAIPPYYQLVDDNQRVGNGPLQQFLSVFGFALDNTREFVEGVLDLHQIDKTPMALLKGLGANYDLPYESGIGDISYRGLVANAPNAQHTRGTAGGLQKVIEAVSKYQTEISPSRTLMLYAGDSDFFNSTGNWGGTQPEGVASLPGTLTSLPWDRIFVTRVSTVPKVGRGVMRVYTSKADGTANLLINVGDSRIPLYENPENPLPDEFPPWIVPPPWMEGPGGEIDLGTSPDLGGVFRSQEVEYAVEYIRAYHTLPAEKIVLPHADEVPPVTNIFRDAPPLTAGIPVSAGAPYGFSLWIQAPEQSFTVQPVLIWIGPSGQPDEVIDVKLGPIANSTDTQWHQYTVQGDAPVSTASTAEARYLIPAVYFFSRIAHSTVNRSAAIDICGVMVYSLGDQGASVSAIAPDRYLTLGEASGEQIGAKKSGFEGFVLGSPNRTT